MSAPTNAVSGDCDRNIVAGRNGYFTKPMDHNKLGEATALQNQLDKPYTARAPLEMEADAAEDWPQAYLAEIPEEPEYLLELWRRGNSPAQDYAKASIPSVARISAELASLVGSSGIPVASATRSSAL